MGPVLFEYPSQGSMGTRPISDHGPMAPSARMQEPEAQEPWAREVPTIRWPCLFRIRCIVSVRAALHGTIRHAGLIIDYWPYY